GDAVNVNRFEVDARFAESVRDVGQYAGLVFEQDQMDFTLRKPNVRCLKRAARDHDIIRKYARPRYACDGAWIIRKRDRAVSHRISVKRTCRRDLTNTASTSPLIHRLGEVA